MINKNFTPFRELHSEEVHEIISHPPHWILRWGIMIFFFLLVLLLVGCWLIKYPDIVKASFTLTSFNAPRRVMAKSEGRLQKLWVKDGQRVEKEQVLLFAESASSHSQIMMLDMEIKRFNGLIRQGKWSMLDSLQVDQYDQIGDVQIDFQVFAQKLSELQIFLRKGVYNTKKNLLLSDLEDLRNLETNLNEQLDLQNKDLELGKAEFSVQEKLFKDKIIASIDFRREQARLIAREMPIKNIGVALIQNRTLQSSKQKEVLELDNDMNERKNSFMQALQSLQSSLNTWKHRYLVVSPLAGKVSFASPLQEQQNILLGQELMTVEPYDSLFQGLLKINQENLGKVSREQPVLIKLDGYPYKEYGMIEGILTKVSDSPGADGIYWGTVQFTNQLNTRYGKKIIYRNGLKGTAEIITSDRRLIERLLSGLRDGGK